METITITVSDELSTQLEPYRDNLSDLLQLGLREKRMKQSLSLFEDGSISLWKAARLADVSLREMTQYAVAQGLSPTADEATLREELG